LIDTHTYADHESDSDEEDDSPAALDRSTPAERAREAADAATAALNAVNAPAAPYLWMLQLNMGVRLSVHNAQLLLIQDAKSARSNAAALVVSAAIHVHSGSREEALAVDLGSCALLPVIYGGGGSGSAELRTQRCQVQ
jgi:hypothetical protein